MDECHPAEFLQISIPVPSTFRPDMLPALFELGIGFCMRRN